jgi:hypothetical protein
MKGYTTQEMVEGYLAKSLTDEQAAQLEELIAAVEAFIDRRLGSGWGDDPIEDEEYDSNGRYLRLRRRPIESVDAITGRLVFGGTYSAIAVDKYELWSANLGIINFPFWRGYERIKVSYSPAEVAVMPGDLRLAATILTAYYLRPALSGFDLSGISSYRLGDDIEVKLATGGNIGGTSRTEAFPAEALDLIDALALRMFA